METINNEFIVRYKTTITTDLDKQQFTEFEKLLKNYSTVIDELIKQVDEGNYAKVNELS